MVGSGTCMNRNGMNIFLGQTKSAHTTNKIPMVSQHDWQSKELNLNGA
jgi:hypothetical protein